MIEDIFNNNGHEYIDLGLPSGTVWSTCNIGASKPTDFGLCFQWGDTQGYTRDQIGTGNGKKSFIGVTINGTQKGWKNIYKIHKSW